MANLTVNARRKLIKEITKLSQAEGDLFRLQVNEDDLFSFEAWVKGPEGTPFARGYYNISLDFLNSSYPAKPPLAKFLTKVFHPNVSLDGQICVNSLTKDWKSTTGIADILQVVYSLLIHPNPDSALNPEASELLHVDYDEYSRVAKLWTNVHASHVPPCFQRNEASPSTASSASASTSVLPAATARSAAAFPGEPQAEQLTTPYPLNRPLKPVKGRTPSSNSILSNFASPLAPVQTGSSGQLNSTAGIEDSTTPSIPTTAAKEVDEATERYTRAAAARREALRTKTVVGIKRGLKRL